MITCFDRFRIVTNGLRYRVERLEWRGILWWRRQKWIPLYDCASRPVEYYTYKEAVDRLFYDAAELRADLHGWTPVAPGREPKDKQEEGGGEQT
jgi:hypothetical protein